MATNQLLFRKPAEPANNVELNLNNLNKTNDFNHLTVIDPDRNIINLQPTVLMSIQVIYHKFP